MINRNITTNTNMNKMFNSGSVKELWKMSYPMMVNFFSMSAMLFVDRIFLSWYSKEALSASVTSGTLAWAFICCIMTLAAMSEVFVSQFNGGRKYENIGRPVWQMLWLCLFSFALFIPAALFVGPAVFPAAINPLENAYFTFFMYVGPFFCVHAAVAGFFIGRGYPKIIQWMAILSNVINIILDPIFIFGIDGYFPSFGMIGAAYATLIGTVIQASVVFLLFLSKKNDKHFNTRNWRFDKNLFLSCLRVGTPPAIFMLLELLGWTLFYFMMRGISETHIFIAGICQSILILFFFVGWGLEKGCIALAGNFIGQKKPELLKKVLHSSFIILLGFSAFLSVILIIYPDPLINWFFESPIGASESDSLAESQAAISQTKGLIRTSLILLFFYIILENARWALNGLLTAAGDTVFLLIAGTFSLWVFCFIPTYFLVYIPKGSIVNAYLIQLVYATLSLGIIYARFARGKWRTKTIVGEENSIETENLPAMETSVVENSEINEEEATSEPTSTNND